MPDFDIQNSYTPSVSGVAPTGAQNLGCAFVRVSRVPVGGIGSSRDGGVQIMFPSVGCVTSTTNEYSDIHPPLISDNWSDNPATTGINEARFDDYTYYR